MIELPDHPWFVGCQFHPIHFDAARRPSLFNAFVRAALENAVVQPPQATPERLQNIA
jgi:CTP synthase